MFRSRMILKVPKRCFASTVDPEEMKVFQDVIKDWWDLNGSMKALHAMNKLRVPFVVNGLRNNKQIEGNNDTLKELKILDVGCGGGILSEALVRLGGNLTGIDPNADMITAAKTHAIRSNFLIDYYATTIEEHAEENSNKYDAIVASEIIEHITNKTDFVKGCVNCLKPNGSIFFTTLNRTLTAQVYGIFGLEQVFKQLPKGTHCIDKFITPNELTLLLGDYNCTTVLTKGMWYNVLNNSWKWSKKDSLFYGLHAVKVPSLGLQH